MKKSVNLFYFSLVCLSLPLIVTISLDGVQNFRLPAAEMQLYRAMARNYTTGIELPQECIVIDRPHVMDNYGYSILEFPANFRPIPAMRKVGITGGNINTGEATSYYGGHLNVVIVKARCEAFLLEKTESTNSRYSIGEGREKIFNYVGGAPRAYCGVPTNSQSNICPTHRLEDRQMMARLDQTSTVSELAPALNIMRAPSRLWGIQEFSRIKMYAIETEDRQASSSWPYLLVKNPGRERLFSHNRVEGRVLNRAHLKYIAYEPNHNHREELQSITGREVTEEIMQKLQRYRERISASNSRLRASQLSFVDHLTTYFFNRSDALKEYWLDGFKFLESKNLDSVSFDAFSRDASSIYGRRGSRERISNPEMDRLFKNITAEILMTTGRALFLPRDSVSMINIAAMWWVTRDMRTIYACDEESNTPYEGMDSVILDEYRYQSCRRDYTTRGHMNLNIQYEADQTIYLNEIAWQVINSVTSRRERGELYAQILPLLQRRMQNGGAIRREELSLIVYHYLQTKKELSINQTLTWKGPVEMTDRDLVQLNADIVNIEEFIQFYIDRAYLGRNEEIKNYVNAHLIFAKLKNGNTNINWQQYVMNDQQLKEYLQMHLEQIHDLDDERVIDLFLLNDFSKNNTSNPAATCDVWTDFFRGLRSSTLSEERREKWQSLRSINPLHCYQLTPNLVEHIAVSGDSAIPFNFSNMCANGLDIACKMNKWGSMFFDNYRTSQHWVEFFNLEGRSFRDTKQGIDIIFERYMYHYRDSNVAQLFNNIENILRSRVVNHLETFPDANMFDDCITRENWNSFVIGQLAVTEAPVLNQTCHSLNPHMSSIIKEMASVMVQSMHGQINYFRFSPIYSYYYWVQKTRSLRLTRLTIPANSKLQFYERMRFFYGSSNRSSGSTSYLMGITNMSIQSRISNYNLEQIALENDNINRILNNCLGRTEHRSCRLLRGDFSLLPNI